VQGRSHDCMVYFGMFVQMINSQRVDGDTNEIIITHNVLW
jgi:hypothetical protein